MKKAFILLLAAAVLGACRTQSPAPTVSGGSSGCWRYSSGRPAPMSSICSSPSGSGPFHNAPAGRPKSDVRCLKSSDWLLVIGYWLLVAGYRVCDRASVLFRDQGWGGRVSPRAAHAGCGASVKAGRARSPSAPSRLNRYFKFSEIPLDSLSAFLVLWCR